MRKRGAFVLYSAALLLGLLAVTACQDGGAATGPPASPAPSEVSASPTPAPAQPTATRPDDQVPSPSPSLVPPASVATPSPTPRPPVLATAVATAGPTSLPLTSLPTQMPGATHGISIDVTSGSATRCIGPGGTALAALTRDGITVAVRYSSPLSAAQRSGLRASITRSPAGWGVAPRSVDGGTFTFELQGTIPGRIDVEVRQDSAPSPAVLAPIGFSVEVSMTRVVTLAEAGQTVTLRSGERFVLSLGEGYDWQLTVDDPSVISRVASITPIRGSQGVYEAHRLGRAVLSGSGDPPCRASQPPCAMPSRAFQVRIVVQ